MDFCREMDRRRRQRQTVLYRYSDGGATPAEGEEKGAVETAEAGEAARQEKQTFDDLLKDKEYQSEFDRRVEKALRTARLKWEDDAKARNSEAQKLSKMSEDEKAEYQRQQQEAKLRKREEDITRRELMMEAKERLAEKGLPISLSETLVYTDADACKASMDAVSKAFEEAVTKAVNDRLRSSPPKTSGPVKDYSKMSDEEYYALVAGKKE